MTSLYRAKASDWTVFTVDLWVRRGEKGNWDVMEDLLLYNLALPFFHFFHLPPGLEAGSAGAMQHWRD